MHSINKMLLGATVSAVTFASVTALRSKLKTKKVDRKSVIQAAVFGAGVGAFAGLLFAQGKRSSMTDSTINSVKAPFKHHPDELFSCSEIAKEFNISRQKVSGTAKKVGVQNNPQYSAKVGRSFQGDRLLYLSDASEYTRDAINKMKPYF